MDGRAVEPSCVYTVRHFPFWERLRILLPSALLSTVSCRIQFKYNVIPSLLHLTFDMIGVAQPAVLVCWFPFEYLVWLLLAFHKSRPAT